MDKATKAQLKEVRELIRDKKFRDETGRFIAEGFKIVRDMIDKGHIPDLVVASKRFIEKDDGKDFLVSTQAKSIQIAAAADSEFEKLSPLQHSQGILAVVRKPKFTGEIPVGTEELMVLCDGIQDPGNLGTIMRTSLAFGVRAILLSGETVDVYNPKVVRASSGTLADLLIYKCDIERLKALKKKGCRILASQAGRTGAEHISLIGELKGPRIIAFGREASGISEEIANLADINFYIPILEEVESLNVTQAVAISLYVFSRKCRE